MKTLNTLAALSLTSAALIGCGGGGGSVTESNVSIGFSDFPVDGAEKVVVTVDSLSFIGPEGEVVVDTFTSAALGITDADTFEFDLLDVQGNDFKLVLDSVVLPVGEYSELRIGVIDEDLEQSYVQALDSEELFELKIPSDELKLGGFTVEARSTQTFIVEFDLRQAMTYNPGPERYILKPRGVRVVGLEQAAIVLGNIDTVSFAALPECMVEEGAPSGSSLYLYAGHELNVDLLKDNFDPEVDLDAPVDAIAPYATAVPDVNGDYLFSFVEPGDYTLAFSCDVPSDDPAVIDEVESVELIEIPAPSTEIVELSLAAGEDAYCGFPLAEGACLTE